MPGSAPIRPIAYAEPSIVCDKAADGSLRLASAAALEPHDPSLAQLFRAAVERNPAGLFLAERDASGPWRKLSYGEAARAQHPAANSRRRPAKPGPARLETSPTRPAYGWWRPW